MDGEWMGIHAPKTLSSEKTFLDFGLSPFGVFLDGRTDGLAGGGAVREVGGMRFPTGVCCSCVLRWQGPNNKGKIGKSLNI